MSIHKLSLYELHEKFTAGEVTATEIVHAYGLRIGQVESKVKAYITQTKDAAVAQAGVLDASLKVWRKTSPMMGMPLAISAGLFVLWILALLTGHEPWKVWWTFAFASGYLLLAGVAGAAGVSGTTRTAPPQTA